MRTVEAVLSDLDGTLLGPDLSIRPSSIQALKDLKVESIKLLPVTGRDFTDVETVLKTHNVNSLGVFSGGSAIVDIPSGEAYYESSIDNTTSRHLIREASKFATMIGFGLGRMAVAAIDLADVTHKPRSIWIEFPHDRQDTAACLIDLFPELTFHSSVHTDPSIIGLHATPVGINKKTTTMRMLDMLGIKPEHTAAIGDEMNDVPLFEVSPICIAMGDAPEALRKVSTHVTTSLGNDGFSRAMHNYVLEAHT